MARSSVLCFVSAGCTHLRIDSTAAVNKTGGPHLKYVSVGTTGVELVPIQNLSEALTGLREQSYKELRTDPDTSELVLNTPMMRGPCSVTICILYSSETFPTYHSWRLDPQAIAVYAVTCSWNNIRGYAIPPFGKCLALITSEKVPRVLLITLTLMEITNLVSSTLLVEAPILLPNDILLTDSHRNPHPMI